MTEAECWRATELIHSIGLVPLRGELRHGRMGRWRHAVYFAAVGTPTRHSLDTGSRDSSEAYLTEVGPPPRPSVQTALAKPRGTNGALPASSTWAGPRQSSPPMMNTMPLPAPPDGAASSATASPSRSAPRAQAQASATPCTQSPSTQQITRGYQLPSSTAALGAGGAAGPHQRLADGTAGTEAGK